MKSLCLTNQNSNMVRIDQYNYRYTHFDKSHSLFFPDLNWKTIDGNGHLHFWNTDHENKKFSIDTAVMIEDIDRYSQLCFYCNKCDEQLFPTALLSDSTSIEFYYFGDVKFNTGEDILLEINQFGKQEIPVIVSSIQYGYDEYVAKHLYNVKCIVTLRDAYSI